MAVVPQLVRQHQLQLIRLIMQTFPIHQIHFVHLEPIQHQHLLFRVHQEILVALVLHL